MESSAERTFLGRDGRGGSFTIFFLVVSDGREVSFSSEAADLLTCAETWLIKKAKMKKPTIFLMCMMNISP